MKIALTGSQGFIGTNLCNRLLISHEVENFDFISTASSPYLLLEKLRQKENYDFVLHFGANANAQEMVFSKLIDKNITYTNELALLCATNDIPLVFASSMATYGRKNEPLRNKYAISKKISENYILNISEFFPKWRILILRLSNIYGFNESSKREMCSIPYRFISDAASRRSIDIWTKQLDSKLIIPSRDFLFIDDLLSLVEMLTSLQFWEVNTMDIGSGISTSFLDIAKQICTLVESEVNLVNLPETVNPESYQFNTKANLVNLFKLIPAFSFQKIEKVIPIMITSLK
jgi:ADP-L-glycero-D-manno-heptose 6-epimerase